MGKRSFLEAEWRNLLLVTWKVPDALLLPHLPPGVELDRYEGSALVSLVAFDFLNTRVFGVKWPGYTNFPELNLRFYIKAGNKRGVAFIREYVPSRLVAAIARGIYNEPYVRAPYRKVTQSSKHEHLLSVGGREHRIAWQVDGEPSLPAEDSLAHFLKEHDLGAGKNKSGETIFYEVSHPYWRTWKSVSPKFDVDFGLLYGDEWSFLGDEEPLSVIAAEGSEVKVHPAATNVPR